MRPPLPLATFNTMAAALHGYPGADVVSRVADGEDPLIEALAQRLATPQLGVIRHLGQSKLRCDLAVGTAGSSDYQLAILTDSENHYTLVDVVDRYVTRPEILRSAGWQVRFALAKDWLTDPDRLTTDLCGPPRLF